MKATNEKLEAYNEAVTICERFINYKGDKRRLAYKNLERSVVELFVGRMNSFGKQLGLPTYTEKFF